MNNTYPCKGWQVPVNNFKAWNTFFKYGMYEPANQNHVIRDTNGNIVMEVK